jgi:type I pantothenate kinase
MSAKEAEEFGHWAWNGINLPNLRDNILPTRSRADLVLTKGPSHAVEHVALRKV